MIGGYGERCRVSLMERMTQEELLQMTDKKIQQVEGESHATYYIEPIIHYVSYPQLHCIVSSFILKHG